MEYGSMKWVDVAKLVDNGIAEVDWEDKSFICPHCGEPILAEDWYYMPAGECGDEVVPYCPICGCCFK